MVLFWSLATHSPSEIQTWPQPSGTGWPKTKKGRDHRYQSPGVSEMEHRKMVAENTELERAVGVLMHSEAPNPGSQACVLTPQDSHALS